MKKVIQGKLMYLRMVKGEDSPVWRRLQKRFDRLAGRKESSGGTDIVYLHSYPIEAFEKALGTTVELYGALPTDPGCEPELPPVPYPCPHFTLNGCRHPVALSRYAHTRLVNILDGGREEEETARFKQRFQIACCRRPQVTLIRDGQPVEYPEGRPFWMIYRGIRKKKAPALEIVEEALFLPHTDGTEIPLPETDAAGDTPGGLSSDEMLDVLVDSGFDLNTLEQWEKTRKDN